MVLSDREIRQRLYPYPAELEEWQKIKIAPLNEQALQPASIDLRLSGDFIFFPLRTEDNRPIFHHQDTLQPQNSPGKTYQYEGVVLLLPGWFALGSTIETVTVPEDLVANLMGKSSLGRQGLIVHATAGWCDPGFRGRITLELNNISPYPLKLHVGQYIAQLAFTQLTSRVIVPYGEKKLRSRYQGQDTVTAARPYASSDEPAPKS